jgi:hypothetical protein
MFNFHDLRRAYEWLDETDQEHARLAREVAHTPHPFTDQHQATRATMQVFLGMLYMTDLTPGDAAEALGKVADQIDALVAVIAASHAAAMSNGSPVISESLRFDTDSLREVISREIYSLMVQRRLVDDGSRYMLNSIEETLSALMYYLGDFRKFEWVAALCSGGGTPMHALARIRDDGEFVTLRAASICCAVVRRMEIDYRNHIQEKSHEQAV